MANAFKKPVKPDAGLAEIVGSRPLARTAIVKKLWEYIKKHKLQVKTDKRKIKADATLKAAFGKSTFDMFELAGLIGEHIS